MMSFVSLDLSFSLSFSLLDVGVFGEIWVFVVATFESRSIFTTSVSSEAPLLSSSVKQRRFLCTFHLPVLFVSFTFFFILADRLLLFQLLLIMSLSLSLRSIVSLGVHLSQDTKREVREREEGCKRERDNIFSQHEIECKRKKSRFTDFSHSIRLSMNVSSHLFFSLSL